MLCCKPPAAPPPLPPQSDAPHFFAGATAKMPPEELFEVEIQYGSERRVVLAPRDVELVQVHEKALEVCRQTLDEDSPCMIIALCAGCSRSHGIRATTMYTAFRHCHH